MVFLSKLGDLQKKKKKRSSPKFKEFFRPNTEDLRKKSLHRNSKGFSGRNQKFKDFFRPITGDLKKSLLRNSKGFSGRNQIFKGFFWPKSGDLQKKKSLHRLWASSRTKKLHYSGPNNGKFFTTSAPKSFRGGIFIFGAKIGLKSTKNELFCILFRPMGGGRAAPPWLRYWSIVDNSDIILTYSIYFVSLSTANKPTTLKLANFVCS